MSSLRGGAGSGGAEEGRRRGAGATPESRLPWPVGQPAVARQDGQPVARSARSHPQKCGETEEPFVEIIGPRVVGADEPGGGVVDHSDELAKDQIVA